MHVSIPVEGTCEFINIAPVNPLISKCQIKVCYVSDKPNRNGSVITKEVATDMAKSLPGCPIVGFYNDKTGDFEEHNKMIDVSNGKFEIIDTTKAYGFVDMNAKTWFQKFVDDGVEHEYLMTEGYIWSDIYPESARVTERGNNQSMELDDKRVKGDWAFDDNGMPQFFIINEAIIKKLCILGENVEPCFEGAQIAAQFSFDGEFKNTLFSMIKELQTALQEGGTTQMNDEEKKVLEGQENPEDTEFKKKDEKEGEKKDNPFEKKDDKASEDKKDASEDKKDSEDKSSEDKKDEDEEDKKKKKNKFALEEIPEYVELQNNFAAVQSELEALKAEIGPLKEFKAAAEKKDKQAMIDSFYMLSDEDKKDVIDNIDTYSLNDIEAKLSIICVRNKVSFSLDEDKTEDKKPSDPVTYSLSNDDESDTAPAWIKAVRNTAKNM